MESQNGIHRVRLWCQGPFPLAPGSGQERPDRGQDVPSGAGREDSQKPESDLTGREDVLPAAVGGARGCRGRLQVAEVLTTQGRRIRRAA